MPEEAGLDIQAYRDSFRQGAVSVVMVPGDRSRAVARQVVRYFTQEEGLMTLYATVSRPYHSVERELQEAGAATDKIFYLDAASRVGGNSLAKSENVVYLNPRNLTQMSIAISNACSSVRDREVLVVFDSLSTLAVYNDQRTVAKFAHALMGKLRREKNAISVMLSICDETDDELESHFTQFADEVIHLEE